jgi:hypothetical protein
MSRKSAAVGTGAMALSPLVDMVGGIVDWKHDVDKTDNFFKIFVLTLSSLPLQLQEPTQVLKRGRFLHLDSYTDVSCVSSML